MRFSLALCLTSMLGTGCMLLASFDGLEGGGGKPTAAGTGGAGGAGGAGDPDGGGGAGVDASFDAPSDGEGGGADASDGPLEAEAGPRKPTVFRDNLAGNPVGITVNATHVYWVHKVAVGLVRAPKVGDAKPEYVNVSVDRVSDVFDIGVDATYLYWSTNNERIVRRRPLVGASDAGPLQEIGFGQIRTTYLAVDGAGGVYTTAYDSSGRAGHLVYGAYAPPTTSILTARELNVSGVAVCGNKIYWGSDTSTLSAGEVMNGAPVGTPLALNVADPADYIRGVACDDKRVYWVAGNQIIRALTVIDRTVEDLYRATAPLGSNELPSDLAVDEASIYFTAPLEKRIYRLAKP